MMFVEMLSLLLKYKLFCVNHSRLFYTSVIWLILLYISVQAYEEPYLDYHTDTWVATDALGRVLPSYEEVGPRREGKLVGMFYYIWHGAHGNKIYDITKILKDNPENPEWGPEGEFHFWGEPEYGYYRSEDPWVIRRDLQMLSVAGVDFIFFDITNARIYLDTVKALCQVSIAMRKEGIKTPQVCFLSNTHSGRVMNQVFDEFYDKGLYRELWFYWDGKPLIMGKGDDPELRPEVKAFFTMKRSWAWTNTKKEPNHWQWLDQYPQDWGWNNAPDIPEQITVSTAQHPISTKGISFCRGKQPTVQRDYTTRFTDRGLFFDEQWKRALEVDPQVVMVTQWNEWIAQRFIWDKGNGVYAGLPIKDGESYFVDAFSREFNRDIVPMKGGHTDNYYYQLISNIRRFKGMASIEVASAPQTIEIDGQFGEWATVNPVFYDIPGDTMHRNFKGYDPSMIYVNKTGRNDIVESRVAHDSMNVYFYVKTQQTLTPHTDTNWMLLFIDSDQKSENGWQGYDYVVNLEKRSSTLTSLHKFERSLWEPRTMSTIPYRTQNKYLEISIPRELLGFKNAPIRLDFHWTDNIQKYGDIVEFSVNGDSAPDRRFNYRYVSEN